MPRTKNDNKRAVARVVVVEARNLPIERSKQCNIYCSLQLKNQKERTRSVAIDGSPIWKDTFEFYFYGEMQDQQQLCVKIKYQNPIHKKDGFSQNDEIGKLRINLGVLKYESTVDIWENLDGENKGKLHLSVTISGFNYEIPKPDDNQPNFFDSHILPLLPYGFEHVGKLNISIHGARGLKESTMLNVFCIISLNNQYRQTQTIKCFSQTLAPLWNRHFEFDVQDACDCVNISVLDEQKDKKHRLLGRLKIPLLQISDSQKKWYQLKDNDLRTQAKGDNPEIYLQFSFTYTTGNVYRAVALHKIFENKTGLL